MRACRNALIVFFILLLGMLTKTHAQFSWKPKPYPECRSFAVTAIEFPCLSKNSDFYACGFGDQVDSWRRKRRTSLPANYGFHKDSIHQKRERPKPPLRFGKIMAQFGAGVIGGLIGNIIWVNQFENTKAEGDAVYNPTRHHMMFLSSILGTSLGVYVIGNIGDSHGSYFFTFLGGLLGSLPLSLRFDDPYYGLYAMSFGLLLQSAGSVIGFNLFREYDSNPGPVGLLNMKNNQVFWSVPTIMAHVNSTEKYPSLSYRINIIHFDFN
ncbi:MAG: hypothetical protein D6732_19870 [Methanobacteriota archaeon]|nr:MAG: hypothetical protein D6732_19870 [Euryarchaeota archaeon]